MTAPRFRIVRHLGRYRQIVGVFIKHGFGFAIDHLGLHGGLLHPRLRRQAERPPSFPEDLAKHFRLSLEELGPTFVKLGQILSTRPDLLPPAYIAELTKLQDSVPPAPWESVRATLLQELGFEPERVFVELDPEPMAAASLAQVHAACLPGGEDVIVKVQRPGITEVIQKDLEILSDLAAVAQRTSLGQVYDTIGIVEDFAFTLRNELDYRREGRNADRFRANFTNETHLYIPRVHWEHTTRRVLVLERIDGIKINDIVALDAGGFDRHRVALHSARIIVKEVLEDGFFHADPHPGNFVVMPGEIIGAMDFGMVGHLSRRDRLNLIRLYIASVRLQNERIVEQLVRMEAAQATVDRDALARDVGRLLTKYRDLPLKEIRAREVIEEIMPLAFRHHLRLPSDLWLLGKTLAMMEGVGLQLDPDFDIFAVSEPIMRRLTREFWMPGVWGPSLLADLDAWGQLFRMAPRSGARLLQSLEKGELPLSLNFRGSDETLTRLDRIVNRLALSILTAALIIGLSMLVPAIGGGGFVQGLVILGFVAAVAFGAWLLVSMIRGRS